jgi:1-deoxy-D-xylulose-5-phosphate reductoisomerase
VIGLTVLGATGSIGVSTLDVVARNPDRFRVVALTAHRDDRRLADQCLAFRPEVAVMADPHAAARLRQRLAAAGSRTEVLEGAPALAQVAAMSEVEAVMAGIVGAAGLLPTLAAARAGKRVLLANKEALVMSGRLFMDAVQASGAVLLPIDSEHNAVFQCLPAPLPNGLEGAGVRRILLTGSGGPFRRTPATAMSAVTPEQACAHPNWSMGRKISVDSATMMNKGLEVIEACWLFDAPPSRVEVLVHPQSVIHSMVEYADGSVLAQLGNPDMRTPIAHGLAWPNRIDSGASALDLLQVARLDFEPADQKRFPCLALGFEAARSGSAACAVLNAANEVAVQAFLEGSIRFPHIPQLIREALERADLVEPGGLDDVLDLDGQGRRLAAEAIVRLDAVGF